MSINLVISEICRNFKALIYKQLQTKIAMITEDKVTEIFCMADDFCKFFDAMATKERLLRIITSLALSGLSVRKIKMPLFPNRKEYR